MGALQETAMILLAFASLATAAPAIPSSDLHDALLARFEDTSGQGGCLTGLVMELRANWALFTPAERARMTAALSPFKADLLDPMPESAAVPPPAGEPTDTCFGQQGDNRLTGAHFAVEWDEGSVTEAIAQGFLDDLEYARDVEVDEQGWKPVSSDASYLMLAFIDDHATGGAYTTVDVCHGLYAPYIVAGNDAVKYGTWTDEMAAHELVHAIQFNYSFAPEFWWWEATATYVQSQVRDSTNWADYLSGYTSQPYIAMGSSSQSDQDVFWHMYGLSIFGHYLADFHGGRDTVRETWENAESERGQYNYGGKDIVEDLGLDWETTYIDFITKNVSMEYDQQRYFPDIDTSDKASSFPADGGEDGNQRPQGYGQNYIKFEGGNGSGDLHVTFSGDTDVDWALVLAETDGSVVTSSVSVIAEDGAGEITFPGYGDEDVYLVVSPMDAADTKRDYTWTAELVSGAPPEDSGGEDSADDVTRGGLDGGGDASGCGCAAAPGPSGLGLLVGLAGLALARRRLV